MNTCAIINLQTDQVLESNLDPYDALQKVHDYITNEMKKNGTSEADACALFGMTEDGVLVFADGMNI